MPRTAVVAAAALLSSLASAAPGQAPAGSAARDVAPLTIGETFTITSRALNEDRRINVYAPPAPADSADAPRPVLYMPDGGIKEDFLHVAGLLQVSVGNGTMRPFLLVGIENTERRRDMTGPTDDPRDRRIAPRVGGSAAFRTFIRTELMPTIRARYRTTGETAIVGESLAGLFVVETLLREPDLFDTYIAFDPSLRWNSGRLVADAGTRRAARPSRAKTLFVATGSDAGLDTLAPRLVAAVRSGAVSGIACQYVPMPDETHATIYHPAALRAFRTLFKPAPAKK
jgi:predicted alpha/beta superfamily hydrolase